MEKVENMENNILDLDLDFDSNHLLDLSVDVPLDLDVAVDVAVDVDIECTSDSEDDSEIESFMDKLSMDETDEFVQTIHSFIEEYIENNLLHFSHPQFHEDLIDEVSHIVFQPLLDANILENDHYDELREHVSYYADCFFEEGPIPLRQQCMDTTNRFNPESIDILKNKIDYLRNIPQPKQRTAEWYQFRHNLLTASNIWKVFSTDSQMNSLIYEKCKPINMYQMENSNVNTESPMHWGVKYEPLTVMFYEKKRNVKIEDFGCIRHSMYPFLGASPDGIVVSDHLYGRMLEIKNIVNRDIDGIPSEAYWIQMQLQMETCNLDVCDFVETRFKEYEDEAQFYDDTDNNESVRKGLILYFIAKKGSTNPHYVYMPLDNKLDLDSVNEWVHSQRCLLEETHALFQRLYWRLDEYSCIEVRRNRNWFEAAVPKIADLWKTIEKERVDGFDHRMAKKRKPVTEIIVESGTTINGTQIIRNMPVTQSVCLVKLDGES